MNKIILITGGGKGIGAATSIMAAEKGYSICLTYKDDKKSAELVANKINSSGGKAVIYKTDISIENDVKNLFNFIDKKLGLI